MSPFETFLSHPSAGNLLLVLIVWMLGAAGWEVVHRSDEEGLAGAFRAIKEIALLYVTVIALFAWFVTSLSLTGGGGRALLLFFGTVSPVAGIWLVKRRRRP